MAAVTFSGEMLSSREGARGFGKFKLNGLLEVLRPDTRIKCELQTLKDVRRRNIPLVCDYK